MSLNIEGEVADFLKGELPAESRFYLDMVGMDLQEQRIAYMLFRSIAPNSRPNPEKMIGMSCWDLSKDQCFNTEELSKLQSAGLALVTSLEDIGVLEVSNKREGKTAVSSSFRFLEDNQSMATTFGCLVDFGLLIGVPSREIVQNFNISEFYRTNSIE